jgi:hypothetical protein
MLGQRMFLRSQHLDRAKQLEVFNEIRHARQIGFCLARKRRDHENTNVRYFCNWFKLDLHHLGKRFALTGVLARNIRRGLSSKGVSVGHIIQVR